MRSIALVQQEGRCRFAFDAFGVSDVQKKAFDDFAFGEHPVLLVEVESRKRRGEKMSLTLRERWMRALGVREPWEIFKLYVRALAYRCTPASQRHKKPRFMILEYDGILRLKDLAEPRLTHSLWGPLGAMPFYNLLAQLVVSRAPPENGNVLMLGLGGGCCAARMLGLLPTLSITGVEISKHVASLARTVFMQRYARDGIDISRLTVVVGDAAQVAELPLPSRAYDVIISDVPHTYEDGSDEHFFTQLSAVASSGCVLIANSLIPRGAAERVLATLRDDASSWHVAEQVQHRGNLITISNLRPRSSERCPAGPPGSPEDRVLSS